MCRLGISFTYCLRHPHPNGVGAATSPAGSASCRCPKLAESITNFKADAVSHLPRRVGMSKFDTSANCLRQPTPYWCRFVAIFPSGLGSRRSNFARAAPTQLKFENNFPSTALHDVQSSWTRPTRPASNRYKNIIHRKEERSHSFVSAWTILSNQNFEMKQKNADTSNISISISASRDR